MADDDDYEKLFLRPLDAVARGQKDLEPILNTMQLHGQWIDGSFFGKNDDYHAKSFLLNYGAHTVAMIKQSLLIVTKMDMWLYGPPSLLLAMQK